MRSNFHTAPIVVLALVVASLGLGSERQASPPAQAQDTQVVIAGDSAVVLNYVKADKASDFESVMAKVKEALEKSQAPERRQQAAGWKMFKAAEPVGEGQVLFVWIIDPAVKGADYSVPKILSEGFPAEAKRLYEQYAGAYAKGKLVIAGNRVLSMEQESLRSPVP